LSPRIEAARLDGSARRVLVLANAASLTIDFHSSKLYWTGHSGDGSCIFSCSLTIHNVSGMQSCEQLLLTCSGRPTSVAVFDHVIYWYEAESGAVRWAMSAAYGNLASSGNRTAVVGVGDVVSMAVLPFARLSGECVGRA